MFTINFSEKDTCVLAEIAGAVNTNTALQLESEFFAYFKPEENKKYVFDVSKLEYISSAGLRFFLKIKKSKCAFEIINASKAVYDVFEITGFTKILTVKRAHRELSVEGCNILGRGSNGIVYRLDDETILKLYMKPDCMDDIVNEREHCEYAMLIGVPTAISYDIVKVGDKFGTVFELIDAKSIAGILREDADALKDWIKPYSDLLKATHSIEYIPGGKITLPDAKRKLSDWTDYVKNTLTENETACLERFIASIPDSSTVLHGDPQPNNVMATRDELLFIDMDTLSIGDPLFDFSYMYASLIGYRALMPDDNLIGLDRELQKKLWHALFDEYYSELTISEKLKKEHVCKAVASLQIYRNTVKYQKKYSEKYGRDIPSEAKITLFRALEDALND